jgi:GGDEF domain-containing protein
LHGLTVIEHNICSVNKRDNVLMHFLISRLICALSVIIAMSCGAAETEQHSQDVAYYFQQTATKLDEEKVLQLAQQIIPNRHYYTSDTIAKMFVLLADLALRKQEFGKAAQFAEDGLAIMVNDLDVQLALRFKFAAASYLAGNYSQLLRLSEQLVDVLAEQQLTESKLLALGYRAVANAQLTNYQAAITDVARIKTLMAEIAKPRYHVELYQVLANVNHYLGNHQAALDYYLTILKLKFDTAETVLVEQVYYQIAEEYRQLSKYDDAFNAYWEGRKFAMASGDPVQIAYAELGLAELLLQQEKYQQAYDALIKIEKLFNAQDLPSIYLTTLIALAKSALHIDKPLFAYQVLTQAESIAQGIVLSREQLDFYRLLAQKYQYQGEYQRVSESLNLYISKMDQFLSIEKLKRLTKDQVKQHSEKSSELTQYLSEQEEFKASFNEKLQRQQQLQWISLMFIICLIFIAIYLWIKYRSLRLNHEFMELEKPEYYLASPVKTRQIYQLEFIKARKYQYPITVVLLSISNWSDIKFNFRKKVVAEVVKTIATIINEHISEFDHVGSVEPGEYLLLFPHQSTSTISLVINQLIEALNVRFFANLGNFSVIIQHTIASPAAPDIDPFVFLSTLTDATTPFTNLPKEKS